MFDKTTIGYCIEGFLVVAGLILLVRLWRVARRDPTSASRRLPPRQAFDADLLFFLIAMLVPMALGWLAASYGSHFFPDADSGHLTLGATYVQEFAMMAVIGVYYWWSAFSERAQPASGPSQRLETTALYPPTSEVYPPSSPLLAPGSPPLSPSFTWPVPLPALSTGMVTFLAALPVVYLVSAIWQTLLDACGYPVAHQNIVEVFLGFTTPLTQALFTIVAAVLVPFNEEMIFRGGLFRGLLAAVPRRWAIGISALVFAAAHLDVTSFAPLTVLGVAFALAYERTGNIRTVIIAHALFNLNTLGALLLGVNA